MTNEGCQVKDCDHLVFYTSAHEKYCACHLPIVIFRGLERRLQTRAIERSAMENDDFEVTPTPDGEVDIRLRDMMSDFWQKRLEARWDYEQYNKGSVGVFYKVVAVLKDDEEQRVESVMCELIRDERTAVSIVDDHNEQLRLRTMDGDLQEEDDVPAHSLDVPRKNPKYLITIAIMSRSGGSNYGDIADSFVDDGFFESYARAREWLRPWENFIDQYEDWGSMVDVWAPHIPDEPPVD